MAHIPAPLVDLTLVLRVDSTLDPMVDHTLDPLVDHTLDLLEDLSLVLLVDPTPVCLVGHIQGPLGDLILGLQVGLQMYHILDLPVLQLEAPQVHQLLPHLVHLVPLMPGVVAPQHLIHHIPLVALQVEVLHHILVAPVGLHHISPLAVLLHILHQVVLLPILPLVDPLVVLRVALLLALDTANPHMEPLVVPLVVHLASMAVTEALHPIAILVIQGPVPQEHLVVPHPLDIHHHLMQQVVHQALKEHILDHILGMECPLHLNPQAIQDIQGLTQDNTPTALCPLIQRVVLLVHLAQQQSQLHPHQQLLHQLPQLHLQLAQVQQILLRHHHLQHQLHLLQAPLQLQQFQLRLLPLADQQMPPHLLKDQRITCHHIDLGQLTPKIVRGVVDIPLLDLVHLGLPTEPHLTDHLLVHHPILEDRLRMGILMDHIPDLATLLTLVIQVALQAVTQDILQLSKEVTPHPRMVLLLLVLAVTPLNPLLVLGATHLHLMLVDILDILLIMDHIRHSTTTHHTHKVKDMVSTGPDPQLVDPWDLLLPVVAILATIMVDILLNRVLVGHLPRVLGDLPHLKAQGDLPHPKVELQHHLCHNRKVIQKMRFWICWKIFLLEEMNMWMKITNERYYYL